MIKYEIPTFWIRYDLPAVQKELIEAESAVLALRAIPYQRDWVESLQHMELKREVAGTSRIEGAEFTERELDEAIKETPEQLVTRSQRQAHAAVGTYRWIATIPDDRPIDASLVQEMHRRIVTGADDDHCEPGKIRTQDENVSFGQPRHRGANGGHECSEAFEGFMRAIREEYREHNPIIQGMAAHYHLAAMHPFVDGNGRCARALEALFLQRAGLRNTCFVAMSNYYYDEKVAYLQALAESRALEHDITPFLVLGLRGVAIQSRRLLQEIRVHVRKALYRNLMHDLFGRLKTPRKRVIAKRQLHILGMLLKEDTMELIDLFRRVEIHYRDLASPFKAFIRDLGALLILKAIDAEKVGEHLDVSIRLEWPTEITETDFMERIKTLPKAKTLSFLR